MRLDAEIKKLLQKEEQEIVGIIQKFKNRILKKDKAVAEYLGVQHVELVCIIREIIKEYDYIQHKIARGQPTSTEEMELLEIDKSQNKAYKVSNQMLIEKDILLQLECAPIT